VSIRYCESLEQTTQIGLVRGIGRWDLVGLMINIIVGAGIFGLPAKIYALTGVWSLLAYIVCAGLVTLITLCFAEVGSRFAGTGGPYLYAHTGFGPLIGFELVMELSGTIAPSLFLTKNCPTCSTLVR